MILVTPLSAIDPSIRRYQPSHMVTLLSPEHMIPAWNGMLPGRHLRLPLEDVSDAFLSDSAPCAEHIDRLVAFGRGWNAEAPMLVHCWAGISRSMAAAFTILCDKLEPGRELEIARAIRARAPHAYPNRLMIQLADDALGREGRMVSAVEEIGRGIIVAEGTCVELPLSLDRLASDR